MIKVISVSTADKRSDESTAPTDSVVPGGDTTAPSTPTSISAVAVQAGIDLKWTNPSDVDFAAVQIFRDISDTFPGGSPYMTIAGERGKKMAIRDRNVGYGQTYYYWFKSVDFSDNASSQTASVNASPSRTATDDVEDNAITTPGSAYTDGSITCGDGVETTVQQVTITSTGAPIALHFSLVHNSATACYTRLYRGATQLVSFSTPNQGLISGSISDTPGSGSVTYYLKVYSSGSKTVQNRSLAILETKK